VSVLPDHLCALLRPDAYPHATTTITWVETHMSWVLLTGEFAYKIKRPVRYPFADLSSQERRHFYCQEEVRLNRRFAPELYLDVCEITAAAAGDARIQGTGCVIEHAVKMLQFPREQGLDRLLAADKVAPTELESFGRDLAELHNRLPVAAEPDEWGTAQAIHRTLIDNLKQCAEAGAVFDAREEVLVLEPLLRKQLGTARARLTARREQGFVRECHGDLHARNVVKYKSRLVAFDCMEFEPAFRWIDVADEIAFLSMDLMRHGRAFHANAFLNGYLARSGDYNACRVLGLYMAHRALVRAKVTALEVAGAQQTREIEPARSRFKAYVQIAKRALSPRQPKLILMSGVSGSGKTWLAKQLAPRLDAIHLRSDVERKRLAGLEEHARSGSGLEEGAYTHELSRKVYEHLAECAHSVLGGGFTAIVDATFLLRENRAGLRALADRLRVEPVLIECKAPDTLLHERIEHRLSMNADASEANIDVLRLQQRQLEAVEATERFTLIEIDTRQPNALDDAIRVATASA
jgi:uncharacterized protein